MWFVNVGLLFISMLSSKLVLFVTMNLIDMVNVMEFAIDERTVFVSSHTKFSILGFIVDEFVININR